MQSSLNLA